MAEPHRTASVPSMDWANPFRLSVDNIGWKPSPRVTSRAVIDFMALRYDFSPRDFIGPWRIRPLMNARHIAMWICRKTTSLSYPQIGDIFRRDHSTVVNAVARIERAVKAGDDLGREAQACLSDFQGGA